MNDKLQSWLADKNIRLVAISKTKPAADILELYHKGQRDFGENRVSELVKKQETLPKDIRWHMVGHLQSKKTKQIASFVHMIQSVDSLSLCETINKYALTNNRVINILIQLKIAKEDSKYGYNYNELLVDLPAIISLPHIGIRGVMGMGTLTDDEDLTRSEFIKLHDYFKNIKKDFFPENDAFSEISMGMSGDYKIAIECGATMVRIGSLIFGPRD